MAQQEATGPGKKIATHRAQWLDPAPKPGVTCENATGAKFEQIFGRVLLQGPLMTAYGCHYI